MGTEENKALVRRYIAEACIRDNLGVIDEVFSPDFVYRGIAPPAGLSPPKGSSRRWRRSAPPSRTMR